MDSYILAEYKTLSDDTMRHFEEISSTLTLSCLELVQNGPQLARLPIFCISYVFIILLLQ